MRNGHSFPPFPRPDLKPIYTAATPAEAWLPYEEFDERWGKPYPAIKRLWDNAWDKFIPFLD